MKWRCGAGALGGLVLLSASMTLAATELVTESETERDLRRIATLLQCPVCQGENLYDSRSELALEMRQVIREQLIVGRTDDEIIGYFVDRYGDFVRLEPKRQGVQMLIWLLPAGLALIGFGLVTLLIRRRTQAVPTLPAAEVEAALARIDEPSQ